MHIGVVVDNELDHDVRVLKEIRMMQQLGYTVSVLCFGFDQKKYKKYSFEVHRISISRKRKNQFYFFNLWLPLYRNLWRNEIADFIQSSDIDLLHVHDLYMSLPAKKGIVKSKKDVPLIIDLHENYPVAYPSYSWTKGFLRRILTRPNRWAQLEFKYLHAADGIIVLSQFFKETLQTKYQDLQKKPFYVLPNIPDLEVFENIFEKKTSKNDKVTFLYFGKIGQRRGVFDVMDAIHDLPDLKEKIELLLIGPVDKADKSIFNDKSDKIKGQLQYIPWIELKDLPVYMAQSDVGLAPFEKNPQHESGVANKIYQYMYGQLPMLVSNCKPQEEIIVKKEIGLVFSDFESLKKQLVIFVNMDIDRREAIGEKSYQVLLNQYSLGHFEEGLKNFYDEVNE